MVNLVLENGVTMVNGKRRFLPNLVICHFLIVVTLKALQTVSLQVKNACVGIN